MLHLNIVQAESGTTTSYSRLALVGRVLMLTDLNRDFATIPLLHSIAHVYRVKGCIGLLCTAKSDFCPIEPRRKDDFFKAALNMDRMPSVPSLRQRFAC